MKNNRVVRGSNFELLRVVAILMVLALHYINGGMGGAFNNVVNGSLNYYLMYLIESFCIVAVNCFVLISGYFMVNKDSIRLSKILNLILLTIGYSILFYVLNILIGNVSFNLSEFVRAVLPFSYGVKWFVCSYIVLFLIAPYINKMLKQLDKIEYLKLIGILVMCLSIVPSVFDVTYNDKGYGVLTFILMYSIGGFIRLHYEVDKNKWMYMLAYIMCSLVTFIVSLFTIDAWNYNFIINIVGATALFIFFSKLAISSKVINFLATFTFSVYLIHTEPRLVGVLYRTILQCDKFWNGSYFVLHLIGSVVILYAFCIIPSYCLGKVFEVLKSSINPVSKKLDIKLN